jgi:hypothetical protein
LINAGGFGNAGAIYTDSIIVTANATAKNFINTPDSTATAGGITTLTAASSGVQVFTGTTTQTVRLPSTSTIGLGRVIRIINQSTGDITVETGHPSYLTVVSTGYSSEFMCVSTATNFEYAWTYGPLRAIASNAGVNTLNLASTISKNFIDLVSSTATSGNVTYLFSYSSGVQVLTGSTYHTIRMPDVTTLTLGRVFRIINQSSGGSIFIVTSDGATPIVSIPIGYSAEFTCVLLTGTTAASWTYGPLRSTSGSTVSIPATTTSTSTTTGSLINAGGFGNAGRVYTTDLTCVNSIIGKSIFCYMVKTSATAVATATLVNPINGGTFTCTTGGFTQSSGVITVSEAGNYVFQFESTISSGSTRWDCEIWYDSSTVLAAQSAVLVTGDTVNVSGVWTLTAGQTVQPYVYQSSGGSINVEGSLFRVYKIVA